MQKILLLTLLNFLAFSLGAASIRGGEITFKQIGPLTLEASVYMYIQSNATATVPDSVTLCWGGGNCSIAAVTNGVDADNDGLPDGEQLTVDQLLGVYIITHTYEVEGQYTLSVNKPNRVPFSNGGLQGQIPFYVESLATVTASSEPHYSPVFYEPAMLDGSTIGRSFTHLPTTFDQDGDSLVHALAIPKSEVGTMPDYLDPTNFNPGANNLLTIDAETGLLDWDAPQRTGRYLVNIIVSTYRDGALREQVTRDMLIEVDEFMALPPSLGLDNTATLQEVLVGEEFTLQAIA
ncbi:MAG: hypothetical protein HRU12_21950, partial [Phaeodactylibacter sp.]|nr:hypothetical protein [Phaeodactylibacter sp.]